MIWIVVDVWFMEMTVVELDHKNPEVQTTTRYLNHCGTKAKVKLSDGTNKQRDIEEERLYCKCLALEKPVQQH